MTVANNDPNLHWNGEKWLRWDGTQWTDGESAALPVVQQPAVQQPAVQQSAVHQPAAQPAANGGELNSTQVLMIQTEITSQLKQAAAAYLFWFFLGAFGGHRFYLNRTGSAVAQLILTCTVVGMVVSIPWALIDVFLIGGMLREENHKISQRIYNQHGLTAAARQ